MGDVFQLAVSGMNEPIGKTRSAQSLEDSWVIAGKSRLLGGLRRRETIRGNTLRPRCFLQPQMSERRAARRQKYDLIILNQSLSAKSPIDRCALAFSICACARKRT